MGVVAMQALGTEHMCLDQGVQWLQHGRAGVFFFLDGAWRKYSVPETAARLIRLVPLMTKQVDIADRADLIYR